MSDAAYTDEDDAADAADAEGGEADVVTDALARFDEIMCAVQEERALALSDRRFASIAGAQWEGDWADQFENSIMVEVNKTAAGVEKIVLDYRANRVTVDFRATTKGADDDTAEMLDGVFRADLYASKGQQALDNAFEEAVQGGIGAWRLTTDYADPYDPENDDQRIGFQAIVDADQSVFWDMNSKLYDKSDAEFCFVVTAMSRGAFIKEYGKDRITDWPQGIEKPYYDWYTPDVVRVAELYEVREATVTIGIYQQRATQEEQRLVQSEISEEDKQALEIEGWRLLRTRRTKQRQIWKTVLSGCEVLKKAKRVPGDCIPVIPVYGKRWFIDNMERSRGHVRLAKDPQRIYNSQISKLTETSALSPIERPIFTPEQINGHADEWAVANIKRAPFSLINPITGPDGMPMVLPIGKVTPPQLPQVLAALIQITANDIEQLTNGSDGADEVRSNTSAEAMDIAATRVDAKSGIYMDNFKQSMQRCGEVYLGMAREIYVEEGRELDTMGENGEQGTVTLAEGHTDEQGRFRIRHDLSNGQYKVIADVSEATATRRDKTVRTLVNVAQIAGQMDPELANAALTTALMNMDGEGMGDFQDWLHKRALTQGLAKPSKDEAAELAQQQQSAQPSASDQALLAQAKALLAQAAKDEALAQKATADVGLSKANTTKALADAQKTQSEAHASAADQHIDHTERKVGIMQRVKDMFTPKPGVQ